LLRYTKINQPLCFICKFRSNHKQPIFSFPMAIAELFIGALITVLFEKLASADLIKLARSARIHNELKKVRENLALIRAVLVDASQKHITDTSVELWLKKLQHLAYEIEDVIDDLATEATRRRLNQESYASTSTSKIT
ncbi:hypothetical protein R6Q59_028448, partial [Mikania micrantha]